MVWRRRPHRIASQLYLKRRRPQRRRSGNPWIRPLSRARALSRVALYLVVQAYVLPVVFVVPPAGIGLLLVLAITGGRIAQYGVSPNQALSKRGHPPGHLQSLSMRPLR